MLGPGCEAEMAFELVSAPDFIFLDCTLAAVQCIVIGPLCGSVCLWVCYPNLRASIIAELD